MKKKKRYGTTLKEQLLASVRDQLVNFVLAGGSVRGALLNGTRMVNEMRWNHDLGILETLVLGHAYLAAGLMSTGLKGNDRLRLQVECSGPIKGLSVEANAFGEVRGYLKQVPIEVTRPLEDFNLSPFFGAGFISVTKYLEDAKQPFTGTVMLEHGTLAKDLALYHLKSEQIPSAFGLSVVFDERGEVQGAGGILLQALPGAEERVLEKLEKRLQTLPSMGRAVLSEQYPGEWLQAHFGDLQPRLLDHRGIEFMCHCSDEQIRSMLILLDPDDLKEMADNGPFPVEVRCHHCNSVYGYGQDQLTSFYHERVSHN